MYVLACRARGSNNAPLFVNKAVVYKTLKEAEQAAANMVSNERGYEYLIYGPMKKVVASEPKLTWEDIT